MGLGGRPRLPHLATAAVDVYHIWCNLRDGVSDVEFADLLRDYLEHLKNEGRVQGYRLTRRKLGLGPSDMGEFHVAIDFHDLAQLDGAFDEVARRADPVEGLHQAVNSQVKDLRFALYRDFPDGVRERGQERF